MRMTHTGHDRNATTAYHTTLDERCYHNDFDLRRGTLCFVHAVHDAHLRFIHHIGRFNIWTFDRGAPSGDAVRMKFTRGLSCFPHVLNKRLRWELLPLFVGGKRGIRNQIRQRMQRGGGLSDRAIVLKC